MRASRGTGSVVSQVRMGGAGALARGPTPWSGLLRETTLPDEGVRRGPGGPPHRKTQPRPLNSSTARIMATMFSTGVPA
jgi:hypothetical protein